MSNILGFLLTDNAYKNIEKNFNDICLQKVSIFIAFFIILLNILGWIFLRLESSRWRWVFQNRDYLFPHITVRPYYPGNGFRYLFQVIWLMLFYSKSQKTPLNSAFDFFRNSLNFYYSKLEKLPEKIKHHNPLKKNLRNYLKINLFIRLSLFVILSIFAIILLLICITQPFAPQAQFVFVILLWIMAMSIRKTPGHISTIMLVVLSIIVSCRYLWWRYAYTLDWDDAVSTVFGTLLIMAETYIWLVMVLGYFQSIWPLHRKPVALPTDRSIWPTVDIMITTYNEDLSILKPGVFSALGLDWPKEKLNIYILDDGNRPEFKAFADKVGVQYIARPQHNHAKAGNINYALQYSNGELIAIFDCDYVITHSFLRLTVGWFLKDPKLAILQTPHHFFSPDPFERNLHSFRKTPNESALFYGVIQDGNDAWDATYFCGSAGILRRSALEQIGGMAVETVTEDAHTSLRLQRLGFHSAYIRIPLAAGLATESLAGHVGQRIRWARGMAQIFRLDNPLFGKGLTWGQRICYFGAMLHFFSGIPRLIFFIIPAAFLLLNAYVVYASGVMILLYAIPHIIHAVITNNRIQGKYRHFLWNEIYETVMAWYIAIPTTMALINPRKGKFNVTAKGGLIKKLYVDWFIARPYLVLLGLNILSLIVAFRRAFIEPESTVIAVIITMVWTIYNIIILGGALGVSIEAKQVRRSPRVSFEMPAKIVRVDDRMFHCIVRDYSDTGLGIEMEMPGLISDGEEVVVLLQHGQNEYAFPGTTMYSSHEFLGIQLHELSLSQNIAFIQCTFAQEGVWSAWQDEFAQDKPLQTMKEVFILDLHGYWDLLEHLPAGIRNKLKGIIFTIEWLGSFVPRRPKLINSRYQDSPELK